MGIKEMAYMRVFGLKLTDEELKQQGHMDIIDSATKKVATFQGLFPGETPADRDQRLEIESALYGESVELGDYLRKVYPDKYEGKTSWDIIFMQLKDMSGTSVTEESAEHLGVGNDNSTVGDVHSTPEEPEVLSINTKPNESIKEDNVMAENTNLGQALENLSATGALSAQNSGSTKPVTDDAMQKAAENAARDAIKDSRSQRIAFMKGAKAVRGIVSQPSLADRAVPNGKVLIVKDGNKATAEAKWEKAYANFCTKTGRVVNDDQTVKYTNVRADSVEAAAAVDAYLKERKADPLGAIQLQDLSKAEQLKGAYVTTPDNPKEDPLTSKELLKLMTDKTLGRLQTSVPSSQYVLRKAGSNQSASGSQGSGAASTASDPWKGVAIVALIKRTDFTAQGVAYAYEIDKNGEHVYNTARVKLPGKVYYKRAASTTDENAQERYSQFSVSAFVECYPTKLNPELQKFQKGEGVGGVGGVALDFNNEEDLKTATAAFENVIASYLVANGGQVPEGGASLFKDAAQLMQNAKAEEIKKETEQMSDIDV